MITKQTNGSIRFDDGYSVRDAPLVVSKEIDANGETYFLFDQPTPDWQNHTTPTQFRKPEAMALIEFLLAGLGIIVDHNGRVVEPKSPDESFEESPDDFEEASETESEQE